MSTEVDNYLAHVGVEVGDELKHYGKKGMKWGQRQAEGSSSGGAKVTRGEKRAVRKAAKEAANKEIIDARIRQAERETDLQKQAFRTYSANGEKAAKAAMNKYARMEVDLITHPDAETASKMTSGEKVATSISAGVNGGIIVAALIASVAIAARS